MNDLRHSIIIQREKKVSIQLLCFAMLFFFYMMKKTHVVANSEQLCNIIDLTEWVFYILAFFCAMIRTKFTKKQFVGIVVVCMAFLVTYLASGFAELLKSALIIVAMKDVDFKQTVRMVRVVLIFSILLTFAMFFLGISDAGVQRRNATSLGYIQANAVGFVFMLLTFMCLILQGGCDILTGLGLFVLNLVAFLLSDGRSAMLISISAIFLSQKCFLRILEKYHWIVKLLAAAPVFCAIFSIGTAVLYPYSSFVQMLDPVFSSRIWMNYYCLSQNKITLFGQAVQLWDMVSLKYDPVRDAYFTFMTADNVYVSMILEMGMVSVALLLILYYRLIIRFAANKQYVPVVVLSLLSVYGIVEASVLSIYVCLPFLAYLSLPVIKLKDHHRLTMRRHL